MSRNDKNITLEDVTIAFRNFAGKESMYNQAGDRNFAILLDPETAANMERDGWNVKYLKAREEGDEPQPYIQVAVSYKTRPPKICMITSKNMTYLSEEDVELLDWADIEQADVTLNPYAWAVGVKSGTKAYVKTLVVKIQEDYLENKWRTFVENNKNEMLALETGKEDYIDGEYELN